MIIVYGYTDSIVHGNMRTVTVFIYAAYEMV
jgi:hypothetical protein